MGMGNKRFNLEIWENMSFENFEIFETFWKFENVITFDSEALDPHVIPQF